MMHGILFYCAKLNANLKQLWYFEPPTLSCHSLCNCLKVKDSPEQTQVVTVSNGFEILHANSFRSICQLFLALKLTLRNLDTS